MDFRSCCLSLFLILVIKSTAAKPTPPQEDKKLCQTMAEDTDFYKKLKAVLSAMDTMVYQDLEQLFRRLKSLKDAKTLVPDSRDTVIQQVVNGRADDMETRCPTGFKAVPGDDMCYYLSSYKVPRNMANEYCMQMRAEPLSIETTRKQFIITHIIQSDPDARKVEKWWTGGKSQGYNWLWDKGLSQELFFTEMWVDDNAKRIDPFDERCVVLDAEHYYQWKSNRCGSAIGKNLRRNSGPPAHHFICQKPALPKQIQSSTQTNKRLPSIVPQTVDIIHQPEIKSSHLIMLNDQPAQEETTTDSQPDTTS